MTMRGHNSRTARAFDLGVVCVFSFFTCGPSAAQSRLVDWSGAYVGAQFGGAVDVGHISDPLGPSRFGNPNLAPGPFAGINVGYNFQSGAVVYGLEADVNFGDIQGTSTCSSVSATIITSNCRTGIDAFGSLTGKLGFTVGPNGRGLIYGKVGASWLNGELDLATNDSTLGATGNPFTSGSDSYTHWGWTLGAGAEYALTGPWSLKAEYDFSRFGNQSVRLLPTANIAPSGAVISTVPAREGTISQDLHVMKLGLTYRFGGYGPEAVDADATPLPVAASGFEFELGGRYWYSWGRHKYDLGLLTSAPAPSYSLVSRLTYDDLNASTGELFGRINTPWSWFAKGFIGAGSTDGGHMNDEDFNIDVSGNQIPHTTTMSEASGDIPAYGTIDVGYEWWKSRDFRFGTFVGYNYYRETIGAFGCWQLINQLGPCGTTPSGGGTVATSGHPIITLASTWQSLRVGAAGEFYLAPRLKLTADAAYLPYVTVDAVDYHFFGNTPSVASINPLRGHGVGAQIEAMLSYELTQQWSIGVGARYWAMRTTEGTFERTYDASGPTTIQRQHLKLETERAGVLGQVTYRFD